MGVDRIKTLSFPLPFIPSRQGRGDYLGLLEYLGRKFSDLKCKNPLTFSGTFCN
jgi:hypothetical protein